MHRYFGGIIGIVIMFIAMIFVAPALKLESKGPLFLNRRELERTEDISTYISSGQCMLMLRTGLRI